MSPTRTTFSDWEPQGPLGRGGTVYRARYVGDRADVPSEVALKIQILDHERHLDWLRRHLEDIRQMPPHPNVATVFDVVDRTGPELGARLDTVRELADCSLLDRMQDVGALPTSELRRLALDMARGIAALHQARLIHGNLKPGNVLAFGSTWKVADSQLLGDCVWYQVPERARALLDGTRSLPPMHRDADVWSFGVVLHEAGVGVRPFASASDLLSGTPTIAATLPEDLRAVIGACLSPVGTRPRDGAELLELLVSP